MANENGSLRSKKPKFLPAVDDGCRRRSRCALADPAGHRLRRALACRRRGRAPWRRRGWRSVSIGSSRLPRRLGGFFGSTLGGSITGAASSSGRCTIRPGGCATAARAASALSRASARSRRRTPRASAGSSSASSGAMLARSAAELASASGVETITVGLGMPEYGIWPVSLTLLKKREELEEVLLQDRVVLVVVAARALDASARGTRGRAC